MAIIGPDGRQIRGTFNNQTMPDAAGMTALWNHKTDVTQSMAARPDTYLVAKLGKEGQSQRLWNQRSRMLLPTRLFLPTTRVVSARIDYPILGSAWVPCKPNTPDVEVEGIEKSLCVYLNSSVGILAIMGDRSNRKPTYPNMSIDDMRRLVVPDFAARGGVAAAKLAAAYDQYAESVMLPLPQLNQCPARVALDSAVTDALGLDEELASGIRRELAREPSITGSRYVGLMG